MMTRGVNLSRASSSFFLSSSSFLEMSVGALVVFKVIRTFLVLWNRSRNEPSFVNTLIGLGAGFEEFGFEDGPGVDRFEGMGEA
jgi:hypothetical protein